MKITLKHPDNPAIKAEAGTDRALGWFCTVWERSRIRHEYDGMAEGYDGLQGLLRTLIQAGFFTREDLEEAIRLLPHMDGSEIEDPGPRRAADIFERLKRMAA